MNKDDDSHRRREALSKTKHWRGEPLITNNSLPLQCFVSSEPSDGTDDIAAAIAPELAAQSNRTEEEGVQNIIQVNLLSKYGIVWRKYIVT